MACAGGVASARPRARRGAVAAQAMPDGGKVVAAAAFGWTYDATHQQETETESRACFDRRSLLRHSRAAAGYQRAPTAAWARRRVSSAMWVAKRVQTAAHPRLDAAETTPQRSWVLRRW